MLQVLVIMDLPYLLYLDTMVLRFSTVQYISHHYSTILVLKYRTQKNAAQRVVLAVADS